MEVYEVGPDDVGEYELKSMQQDQYAWFVFWYENYGYEGDGLGAALRKDGRVEYANLGHCSCYGPLDSWCGQFAGKIADLSEFLKFDELDPDVPGKRRSPKDCDFERWRAVVAKAKELAGGAK